MVKYVFGDALIGVATAQLEGVGENAPTFLLRRLEKVKITTDPQRGQGYLWIESGDEGFFEATDTVTNGRRLFEAVGSRIALRGTPLYIEETIVQRLAKKSPGLLSAA